MSELIVDVEKAVRYLISTMYLPDNVHPLFFVSQKNMEAFANKYKVRWQNNLRFFPDLADTDERKKRFVKKVLTHEKFYIETRKKKIKEAIENYPEQANKIIEKELKNKKNYEEHKTDDKIKDAINNFGNKFCDNKIFVEEFELIQDIYEK